jgi:hypothetical protein
MIEDRLLGSSQLVNLNYPVNFHDEQCASTHDGILGGLERLQNRANVLQQG